jgi:hypothetical protein
MLRFGSQIRRGMMYASGRRRRHLTETAPPALRFCPLTIFCQARRYRRRRLAIKEGHRRRTNREARRYPRADFAFERGSF